MTTTSGSIVDVESALRTISHDSGASETSLTSDKQNERLHASLSNLPSKHTIEPPKSPASPSSRSLERFFTCQKCDSAAYQNFDDLMLHQKETHNFLTQKPIIQPGVRLESKLKRYICRRCRVEFRNAFLLSNHLDEESCTEVKVDSGEKSSLFKQDSDGQWVCPCDYCDYVVKTKFTMSKHLKYAHFQRKDCFVSRDHNLRSSALKYEAEKREAEAKMKRDKEARLAVDREKRRAREVKKQERIAKMQQMAEQQIKAKNDERAASSSSAHSSGRAKKMPERFDDGVSDEMLDFITSDAMAGIYEDGTAKATKKRKAEELEIEYTFEEPVPQEKYVPQLAVVAPPPITHPSLTDPKNAILMPRVKIPPPKRIIEWQPPSSKQQQQQQNANQNSNQRQQQQRSSVIQPNMFHKS